MIIIYEVGTNTFYIKINDDDYIIIIVSTSTTWLLSLRLFKGLYLDYLDIWRDISFTLY